MATIPALVRISMWLLITTYIAGVALAFLERPLLARFQGDEDHLIFGAAVLGAAAMAILLGACFLFIVQSMSRGRNWSRFVLAALTTLEAFYALQLPGNLAGAPSAPFMTAILWLVQCVAVALLFLPASNRWYRSFRVKKGVV